jgi:serine/threonine-protein kinase
MTALRKLLTFFILTICFSILFFLIIDLLVLPYMQGKFDRTVVVPSLIGKDSSSVVALITEAGLRIGTIDYVYHDKLKKGLVTAQYPFPDYAIKLTRSVGLTLSKGKEYKTVPMLLGLAPLDAADTLQRMGLRLGEVSESFNPGDDQGTIIATSPGFGAVLERGSVVNVTIASSTVGNVGYVPAIVNQTVEEAKRLLQLAGLRVGTIVIKRDDEMLPGTVLQQKIQAGTLVSRGSAIDIAVSE